MQSMINQSRPTGRNQSKRGGSRNPRRRTLNTVIGGPRDPIANLGRRLQRAGFSQRGGIATQVTLTANKSNQIRASVPKMAVSGNSARATHAEMISEVLGTELFTIIQSIALNPGLSASFPWLSIQAQGWEQYRFTKLVFHYLYFTGSQTAGQVRLIPDYDALDPPPSSAIASSSYQDAKAGAANANLAAPLTPASMFPMGPRKFIRNGPVANSDLKTYDAGNLFVSTNYAAANATPFGELWVEYECEFFVPQIPTSDGSFLHATSSTPSSGNILPAPTVVSGSLPISVAGDTMTFPALGKYSITLLSSATTSTTINSADFVLTGCSWDASYAAVGDGDTGFFIAGNGTGSNVLSGVLTVTSLPATLQDTGFTMVLPLTTELTVTQLPSIFA